ncbi:MAG: helix-turn-helix domain-containing protein [Clostridia bacterium]|nr:helix-turn-helix domain-containing protein [Clostridia bacterium]
MVVQRTASGPQSSSAQPRKIPLPLELSNLPKFLKISEVSDLLRVSKQTVCQLINDGRLPVVKAGRSLRGARVVKCQLIEWMKGETQ